MFTEGHHLEINPDGRGSSGNWKLDPKRHVDRVIIYKRDDASSDAEVYVGTRSHIVPSNQAGRYVVHLLDVEAAGVTNKNWRDFAETRSQNPVRYVTRPS